MLGYSTTLLSVRLFPSTPLSLNIHTSENISNRSCVKATLKTNFHKLLRFLQVYKNGATTFLHQNLQMQ
jgi:hypothetical protein